MTLMIYGELAPHLIADLRPLILRLAESQASVGSNNVGGWKSSADFLTRAEPCVGALRAELRSLVGEPLVGWAMVNRRGSSHPRHRHGLHYRCGVYYVASGDPPTPTIFEVARETVLDSYANDRAASLPDARGEYHVPPRPGSVTLFSGRIWHRVPTYDGDEPRISIAFEAR